jgi:hypothetical protein
MSHANGLRSRPAEAAILSNVSNALAAVLICLLPAAADAFSVNMCVTTIPHGTVNIGNAAPFVSGTSTYVTACYPPLATIYGTLAAGCVDLNVTGVKPGAFTLADSWTTCPGSIGKSTATFTGNLGTTGYIRPQYKIVGLFYAPPGSKSTVSYASGFQAGSGTMVSTMFGSDVSVTSSGEFGLDLFGLFQAGATETFSYDWNQQQNSSTTFSIVNMESLGSTWPGPLSSGVGVDHDYDTVAIWVNPEVSVNVFVNGIVQVNGFAFDPRDPAKNVDIVYLTIGQLKGTQTIASDTLTALERSWDSSLGAITSADFPTIASVDPFYGNPGLDPNTDTSGRYVFPNGIDQDISYEPEPAGAGQSSTIYTSSYNLSENQSTGGSTKYSTGFSIDGTLSLSFFASAFAELKVSTTLTWTDTWSNTVTSGSSQAANFTIYRPLATDDYTGPINMQVWKDNVYGTFMFYPVP